MYLAFGGVEFTKWIVEKESDLTQDEYLFVLIWNIELYESNHRYLRTESYGK